MSTVTTPAPSQRSHRPPGALKLNAPFSRPRAFAARVRARSVRISSQAFVYVAAFEREERPSGDWSTSTTSETRVEPLDRVVRADLVHAREEPLPHALPGAGREHVHDERRLPRARHAGHGDELVKRKVDGDVLKIICSRTARHGCDRGTLRSDRAPTARRAPF